MNLLIDLEKTRTIATRAISPITQPSDETISSGEYKRFSGIPHHFYYLVFLLLVDLLGYQYLGPGEKVAYIIPIDFKGKRYTIVYAKFGMRIEYAGDGEPEEVFRLLRKGIEAVRKYYEWRAEQAAETSNLNLVSRSNQLWSKFVFLRAQFEDRSRIAGERKDEVVKTPIAVGDSFSGWSISFPAAELAMEANWLREAAVDAFFAWTEHVLIHMAVLQGRLKTGKEVAGLVASEWSAKCKTVFDLTDPDDKSVFDATVRLKTTTRNFVAHGSFGRDGEMFHFHSRVGAVPLRLLDSKARQEFSFFESIDPTEPEDFAVVDRFIDRLFGGTRLPARIYIESGLPTILSYAANGNYAAALSDEAEMTNLVDHLSYESDNAANMDF